MSYLSASRRIAMHRRATLRVSTQRNATQLSEALFMKYFSASPRNSALCNAAHRTAAHRDASRRTAPHRFAPQRAATQRNFSKRACDVALSLIGLIALAPLAALIAILIKVDSAGPAIFAQERLGLRRAKFKCLKFRTMRHGASGSSWTEADDPRVTRVGRILRAVHLDEIPQLVNVLRGEMSIVGPRPIIEVEAEMFGAFLPPYNTRFAILPGMTGWAQVSLGYPQTPAEHIEKFRLDAVYVKRQSFWLDLYIMLRTVGIITQVCGVRLRRRLDYRATLLERSS